MRRRLAVVAIVVLFSFLSAGCSPTSSDPRAELEQKAAAIDSATQDLLEALDVAGLHESTARGVVDVCQSEPAPGVSYRSGIGVKVGDDPVAGFDALVNQLDATGWQSTDAYRDVEIDPGAPAGRFTRDDITLDIKTGGAVVGGESQGADEMALGITIADDCVRVPDGGYVTEVKDLEKDILPRE